MWSTGVQSRAPARAVSQSVRNRSLVPWTQRSYRHADEPITDSSPFARFAFYGHGTGATVRGIDQGWLLYGFDERIELRATSGAAVVNAQGQVVAVHAGGGEENGQVVGVGTPVTKFMGAL